VGKHLAPKGICSACGDRSDAVNQRCSKSIGGVRCSGFYRSPDSQCKACKGTGLQGYDRCEECYGAGHYSISSRTNSQ